VISTQFLPYYNLYQSPGGPVIARLYLGQIVTILYNTEIYEGMVWIEVEDPEGRIGWIPEVFLLDVTPTPIN
jgi:hypothetical protein